MMLPQRRQTAQGFEQQTGVNHLGHFLLTKLLLDKLKASPNGRIVNVSSGIHEAQYKSGGMNTEDLNWEKSYNSMQAYAQSKLANVYFTKKMA